MKPGWKKLFLIAAVAVSLPLSAMAQVTDPDDISVLQAIKNTNNCNGMLQSWQVNGGAFKGAGIEADAEGRLAVLDLESFYVCGELVITGLSGLSVLKVSGNDLNGIRLENLPKMRELGLSYVQPASFAFLRQMPQLERLRMDSTGLGDLTALTVMPGLRYADFSYNHIGDLRPLSAQTQLINLKLFHNLVTDTSPLAVLVNLEHLNLETNRIADVTPLGALNKLKSLNLADNRLQDVGVVQKMPDLATLNLADNSINDVGILKSLPKLVELDLRRNRVRDIMPLKDAFGHFELLLLEGNSLPLHQLYDEASQHRWAASQDNVYFAQRVQYLPVLDYWVIPREDLMLGGAASKVRIEGPKDGAAYDAEKGRVVFNKAGNYKISISNEALLNVGANIALPVTKSGVITVLDVLPDEVELYAGREGLISPAVINTLYMLLQTHGVVEALDDRDPYYDAMWVLRSDMRPPKMYWQK